MMQSAYILTPTPTTLVRWSRVTPNVIPCCSEIFTDWLITRSKTVLPDVDSLNAGGWLQGRSVMFAVLIKLRTAASVTLQ